MVQNDIISPMKHKKLLPAHHTGKLSHHRHTSYGSLALVLAITFVSLIAAGRAVVFASSDPVTADESIHAVVVGPAPATAPLITNLANGAVFTDNGPVTVSGRCPSNTLIKVYKNEVFSGAVFCQNGRFSVEIDLFLGSNTLIVRAYNSNNLVGPEPAPLIVQKNIAGIDTTNASLQFFVTSTIYFKGVKVGEKLSWPLTILGGQAPYAVSVAWGDGKTELISRGVPGTFDIQHIYQKPGEGYKGSYNVTITSTDAIGNTSFIHLVSIVGGDQEGIISGVEQGYNLSPTFRIAWQLAIAAGLFILAFWLGEKRELRLMKKTTGNA